MAIVLMTVNMVELFVFAADCKIKDEKITIRSPENNNTYNYVIVAAISLAAFGTLPVQVPDMRTRFHVTFPVPEIIFIIH